MDDIIFTRRFGTKCHYGGLKRAKIQQKTGVSLILGCQSYMFVERVAEE